MKWITREEVKVDRVACPWLIQKFIDPQAEFVFLPADTDWTSLKEGIVYDVPGCELGHHGEDVSFDSILKKYELADPALTLLAQIVRAADSHPTDVNRGPDGISLAATRAADREIQTVFSRTAHKPRAIPPAPNQYGRSARP